MKLLSEWAITVEVWAEDAEDAYIKAQQAMTRGEKVAAQKADEPGVTYVPAWEAA